MFGIFHLSAHVAQSFVLVFWWCFDAGGGGGGGGGVKIISCKSWSWCKSCLG